MSYAIRYYPMGHSEDEGWVTDEHDEVVVYDSRKKAKRAMQQIVAAAAPREWYEIREYDE